MNTCQLCHKSGYWGERDLRPVVILIEDEDRQLEDDLDFVCRPCRTELRITWNKAKRVMSERLTQFDPPRPLVDPFEVAV